MKLPELIVIALTLAMAAMSPVFAQPAPNQPDIANTPRGLLIGPDDSITILALEAEEISRDWRISSAGDLNLPMIGHVHAAGMTIRELERELARRLKTYIREPQVTVFPSEVRSQPVTITGAVEKPGELQLRGSKTLFEVLMQAGGPKDSGPTITLTRPIESGRVPWASATDDNEGKYSVAELEVREVMEGRSSASQLAILPHDVISVSAIKQQKLVHVVGEVQKPGAIELVTQDRISIMRVLAMAGGLTRGAVPRKTSIMHINPEGTRTNIATVDLKKIMKGKVKDLELTPGDVMVVPSSELKTLVQSASLSAVSSGVYAGVYILGRF